MLNKHIFFYSSNTLETQGPIYLYKEIKLILFFWRKKYEK
jgi:hypothetical protein